MATPEKPAGTPAEPLEGSIRDVSELVVGSRIVYPNQGVCRVKGIETKEIVPGHRLEFVAMAKEEDGAVILVPMAKVPSIGLRHVADSTELADLFDLLASSFDDPELDWKVRHRMHGDLMSAGGVLGVAEVLKALQALANLRPLPQKERERYDAARHLLVHEVAVALGVPECTAEDFIDLALIPPPGTVRPASKPRRLATLPPKPQKPRRVAAAGGEEGLDELGLFDEELPGLGLDEEAGEAEGGEAEGEGEAASEPEAEAEEAEEKPKPAKAPPKAKKEPAAKAKKAPAKKVAPAPEPEPEPTPAPPAEPEPEAALAAEPAPAPRKAPAKKAAKTEAPPAPEKKAPAKKPAAKTAARARDEGEKKAPAKKPAPKAAKPAAKKK